VKRNKKEITIKTKIVIIFILAMAISISGIGYLIFMSWISSTERTTKSIAEAVNESIYDQVYSFMQTPYYINEVQHKIIEAGILDLSNEILREKFFVGVLSAQNDAIYSFSYGTESGDYYGARRNEDGVIEIMRNNSFTGGNSWYYSVDEDLTAGELVVKAGSFDPRTRAWYVAAAETERGVFAPVYKHFIMDDLTISGAWPIYNEMGELQGVLGTHILLSRIEEYLKNSINVYNGYAIIAEKETGALIANSMGIDNYTVSEEGILKHHYISEIQNSDIQKAYASYEENSETEFIYQAKTEKFYVNSQEIQMEGIDWILISAIPEDFLMEDVVSSIWMAFILAVIALGVSVISYDVVVRRLIRPMNHLLQVSAALSAGDLSRRAEVVRKDELGSISESLNQVADKMEYIINNLEATVSERTGELHKAKEELEENRDQLALILNSAAEAIYGIDLRGKCTFCNASCIKILGYSSQNELLGKNMHQQIHHSRRDGRPFPIDECKIIQSIKQGKGLEANDEVFWKADGTSFDVEYYSYPQIKNENIVGGVITFMDITARKQREKEFEYINSHDTLTGLYNRRYFEEIFKDLDTPENLPLSIIFADINGLKITNDIFGHKVGDELIKTSAEILKQICRENDVIARTGGDEFVILLPKTTVQELDKFQECIRIGFLNTRVSAVKCSISLGGDTKISEYQSLEETMGNAENAMYKDKTTNRKTINDELINTLIKTLHARDPREKQHSIVVSQLCGKVGDALHLSRPEISKLKRAAYLHDIGKIILDESILSKDSLSEEEFEKMKQHPVIGYRILNLFDDTVNLAEYVYSHHERWDGKGYPKGLKGKEIPLLSRIILVVETYERILNGSGFSIEKRKKDALAVIWEGRQRQFDPKIAELFLQMMKEKEDKGEKDNG
jgi:diguanylate cyclase (GGDEF)-like protein/PAS domain S-box-containing protein